MSSPFNELTALDYGDFAAPTKISHNEFVIATDSQDLIKYNVDTKLWQKLFDYICDEDMDYHTLSYDTKCNKYYIYSEKSLVIVDMNNNEMESYENPIIDTHIDPNSAFINGQFHLIGGGRSNKHIIFDDNTKEFKEHHKFADIEGGISGPGLIYVESKKIMYLFGGYDENAITRHLDDIWRYSLDTKTWELLQLKLPDSHSDFPIFLTSNERYIVIFLQKKIYYLDLDVMPLEFIQSKLENQVKNAAHAIMMGDTKKSMLTVCGFIRTLCDTMQEINIPKDIIKMIITWYNAADVHVFGTIEYPKYRHWIVSIKSIIPTYCEP